MDLTSPKVTDQDKLELCRKYFYFGFALLPFLWFVNAVWFTREAFLRKPEYPQQKQIRQFVVMSAIGSLAWLVAIAAWLSVYLTNRAAWGELGDRLAFNIPLGRP